MVGRGQQSETEQADWEVLSKSVREPFTDFAVLEFLLTADEFFRSLQNEISVLREVCLILSGSISRLEKAASQSQISIINGTIEVVRSDLKRARSNLKKTVKEFESKLIGLRRFWSEQKENGKLAENLVRAAKSPRKTDAALNELLFRLSEALGGAAAVHKFLIRFSNIAPTALGSTYSKETIRQRITRYKKSLSRDNKHHSLN